MAGGYDSPTLGEQAIQYRCSERGAFGRISSGSKLIEQHQRLAVGSIENVYYLPHVCGKGAEALLNALLVADIGIHLPENRDLRILTRRDMNPALGHQHQQACGFEHDGFAARVRACHQEQVEIITQPYIYGHDVAHDVAHVAALLLACPTEQKRMAGLSQYEVFSVRQVRRRHAIGETKSCFGIGQIDKSERCKTA